MSRKRFFKAALLALVLFTTAPVALKTFEVQTVEAAAKKNGWVKKGKDRYYYKNERNVLEQQKSGNIITIFTVMAGWRKTG